MLYNCRQMTVVVTGAAGHAGMEPSWSSNVHKYSLENYINSSIYGTHRPTTVASNLMATVVG